MRVVEIQNGGEKGGPITYRRSLVLADVRIGLNLGLWQEVSFWGKVKSWPNVWGAGEILPKI